MVKHLIAVVVLFALSSSSLFSQEPNHYYLGEDYFSGVQIYDLIQDDDLNYWMVSDQGLFRYDGYELKYIESDLIEGSSLFNLRKDLDGNIYFNDLRNRI